MSTGMNDKILNKLADHYKTYRFAVSSNTAIAANAFVSWSNDYTTDTDVYLDSSNKKIKFRKAGLVRVHVHLAGLSGSDGRLWCVLRGGEFVAQGLSHGPYVSTDIIAVYNVTTSTELYVEIIDAFTLNSGGVGPCTFTVEYM